MKILLLSPHKHIEDFIRVAGDVVVMYNDKLTPTFAKVFDLGISYGYRHIIKQDVLDELKIINLHISYLPWNRGADPNFWSWFDNTPKGVTIHYIDAGIDTGDIIYQQLIQFSDNETLKSSYDKLTRSIEEAFKILYDLLKMDIVAKKQTEFGTYHKVGDVEKLIEKLYDGWDTPVKNIKRS